jgi:hypothetical protein
MSINKYIGLETYLLQDVTRIKMCYFASNIGIMDFEITLKL